MLNNREIYSTNLPHRAIAVYMYLRDRADKNGQCFPAISTIASDLKMSKSTVNARLMILKKQNIFATSADTDNRAATRQIYIC